MKRFVARITLAATALVAVTAPTLARAQTFQMTGAEPVPAGGHLVGGFIQSSENVLGLIGQLRLSFYPGVDFGFNGGFARQDYSGENHTTLRLGTDLKYQILAPTEARPFTMSIGGALGIETGDSYSLLNLGPTLVASRAFPSNGVSFTPYAGTGIMFNRFEAGDFSDTDVAFPLNIGSEVHINPQLTIVGELQLRVSDSINDDVGFGIGVNSSF